MNQRLLENLRVITPEEQEILNGHLDIQKNCIHPKKTLL